MSSVLNYIQKDGSIICKGQGQGRGERDGGVAAPILRISAEYYVHYVITNNSFIYWLAIIRLLH